MLCLKNVYRVADIHTEINELYEGERIADLAGVFFSIKAFNY